MYIMFLEYEILDIDIWDLYHMDLMNLQFSKRSYIVYFI